MDFRTADGGDNFSSWAARAFGYDTHAIEPLSLDIDKEDGTRILVSGQITNGYMEGCVLVFTHALGTLVRFHITNQDYFHANYPLVFCPYLPSGSTFDGDYYIMYGLETYKTTTETGPTPIDGIVYCDGSDTLQVIAGVDATDWLTWLDVFPSDEKDIIYIEKDLNLHGYLYVNTSANKWPSVTTWTQQARLRAYPYYLIADRHRRVPGLIMMGMREIDPDIPNDKKNKVYLSINKGASWQSMPDLPLNVAVNRIRMDWGTVW